ncbi:MAG: class I SAM-dependent methyltransferase [Oligoflexus sp.]
MKAVDQNRRAWDAAVDKQDIWTRPVDAEEIARARLGDWEIVLTPHKAVPKEWFPAKLQGVKTLCLASGGGQQGPILAAAGADVTVFDNSPKQLAQDEFVAKREKLHLQTVQGDMADLSMFGNESFDLIVHPVSNCFCEKIQPVWQEAYRVLKYQGVLLSGFINPIAFLIDPELERQGIVQIKGQLPYSGVPNPTDDEPLIEFGHSLEEQINGQIQAGFAIVGFYEDIWGDRQKSRHADFKEEYILDQHFPAFMASKAIKLRL